MTAPAVSWTLDQVASVVAAQPTGHPLRRVDRDNALVYDGEQRIEMATPTHEHTAALEDSNLVGVAAAEGSQTPIGAEYDLEIETIVSVRIEGLHHSEWGHIDPAGDAGVPWRGDDGLVDQLRAAILASRQRPAAGRSSVSFTHLQVSNFVDRASEYGEYYRADFDIVFDGFETL